MAALTRQNDEIVYGYAFNDINEKLLERVHKIEKQIAEIESSSSSVLGVVVPNNVTVLKVNEFISSVEDRLDELDKKVFPIHASIENMSTQELLDIKAKIEEILRKRKIKEL